MIILGIDPGTQITGYGLIEKQNNRFRMLDCGSIVLLQAQGMVERLGLLFRNLENIIQSYHPNAVSIEEVFFAKNAASALKLGQCRGVALLAASRAELPVFEYSARTIKQAVTGSGRAEKEQIQKMVQALLALPRSQAPDASDALAAALCHAHHSHSLRQLESVAGKRAAL